ncbi:hypothetical protein [Halostella litorea]|uniref:hypothetical protein n=1 Tax=Halostella litorea TaxID=2528831 RepID=UPI0010920C41|nr:hypothetical protein [Halostella litorea]
MSPNRNSDSGGMPGRSRRRFLATVGVATAGSLAGCAAVDLPGGSEREGEGDTVEILVENRTADPTRIGVRVEDDDGAALFSRVYSLEPDHLDQSAGVDATPATVRAFTPDGTAATWAYAPDDDLDCEGKDVGITLTEEGFESWYGC